MEHNELSRIRISPHHVSRTHSSREPNCSGSLSRSRSARARRGGEGPLDDERDVRDRNRPGYRHIVSRCRSPRRQLCARLVRLSQQSLELRALPQGVSAANFRTAGPPSSRGLVVMKVLGRIERLEAHTPKLRRRIILAWIDKEGRRTKAADTDPHLPDPGSYDSYGPQCHPGGGIQYYVAPAD